MFTSVTVVCVSVPNLGLRLSIGSTGLIWGKGLNTLASGVALETDCDEDLDGVLSATLDETEEEEEDDVD